jgi:hypothetical protein
MQILVRGVRSMGGCCLGGVFGLAAFGVTLGLLTRPRFTSRQDFELAATVAAAAIGFVAGGFVAGWVAGGRQALHGALLGLLLGLFSFSYLLGPGWPSLLASLAAAGLGSAGGWAVYRWRSGGLVRLPGMGA